MAINNNILQDDIDKLIKWSENGADVCLDTGHGNTGVDYEMGGKILCKTVKEEDLGVTINANMKVPNSADNDLAMAG